MKVPSKILDLCQMLDDKKAEDIVICYNDGKNVVDFFIVATMTSSAHIKGTCDYILEECSKMPQDFGDIAVEGFSISTWLVMDLGDVFIHLFTREERAHYNFDKFINDGGNVTTFKKMLSTLERDRKREKTKEEQEEKVKLKKMEKEKIRQAKIKSLNIAKKINDKQNDNSIQQINKETKNNKNKAEKIVKDRINKKKDEKE